MVLTPPSAPAVCAHVPLRRPGCRSRGTGPSRGRRTGTCRDQRAHPPSAEAGQGTLSVCLICCATIAVAYSLVITGRNAATSSPAACPQSSGGETVGGEGT